MKNQIITKKKCTAFLNKVGEQVEIVSTLGKVQRLVKGIFEVMDGEEIDFSDYEEDELVIIKHKEELTTVYKSELNYE